MLLDRLESIGVVLWIEDGRLLYSVPVELESDPLVLSIDSHREALIARLCAGDEVRLRATISSRPLERRSFPLSFAQRRFWFLDKLFLSHAPELRAVHNNPLCLQIEGDLQPELLREAIVRLVRRHSVLRTSYEELDGIPMQCIGEMPEPEFTVVDVSGLSEPERLSQLHALERRTVGEPLDLRAHAMLRASVARVSAKTHLLFLAIHHIASDGWSMELVTAEVARIYAHLAGFTDSLPAPPALQYSDFACWQRKQEQSKGFAQQLTYWVSALSDVKAPFPFPTDRPRPAEQSYRTGVVPYQLDSHVLSGFKRLCARNRTTLFCGLLAAFKILLHRYSRESDVVIGTAAASRHLLEIEDIIGCFANTIALRTTIAPQASFQELLKQVQSTLLAANANKDIPFERIVSELQPDRSFGHAPVFQHLFLLQISEEPALQSGELTWQSIEIGNPLSQYDFTFSIRETPSGLRGSFLYSLDLFDETTIHQLTHLYSNIVEQAIADPNTSVAEFDLSLAPPSMPQQPTGNEERSRASVPMFRKFEARVRESPQSIAVLQDGSGTTYDQLNRRANRLANRLIRLGAKPGRIIAIMAERTQNLIVALIAVAKSGAGYLPLDMSHPPARLQAMIDDAGAEIGILDDEQGSTVSLRRILGLSSLESLEEPEENLAHEPEESDVAYVIYTSGSSGAPKGVAVSHKNLSLVLADMVRRIPVSRDDAWLAITSIAFDIAALELFGPLVAGASILLATRDTVADARLLGRLSRDGVTIMQATPTMWRLLLETGWRPPSGVSLITGGEALTSDLLSKLAQDNRQLWNMYGPTETTIWSTAARLSAGDRVSIGRPIDCARVYVLDDRRRPVPRGAPGELYIGGESVALGYWKQQELTEARFPRDPFNALPNARMYRTGDKVRELVNGDLEFLGRLDSQVKIRGHRVELEEVEAAISKDAAVAQVAVVSRSVDSNGSAELTAFVVPAASPDARSVEFGIFFFAGESSERAGDRYDLYIAASRKADELGLSSIWTPERHFHPVGGLYPNPAILSAALCMVTRNIRICAGSVVLPLHDPLRVAEQWSVLDNLSEGRVAIACAPGWNVRDFAFNPGAYSRRHDLTAESIETVRKLWRGERVRRRSGTDEIDIAIYPRPRQPELPLWITASNSPDSFALAGRLGANVLTHLLGQTVEELSEKIRVYRRSRSAGGHQGPGKVTLMLHTYIANDAATARSHCREPFANYLKGHISLDLASRSRQDGRTDDVSEVVDIALDRYMTSASLIGDLESCKRIVRQLAVSGVDEIACLLDFGLPSASVLAGMDNIKPLQSAATPTIQFCPNELRTRLRRASPEYLIPSRVIVTDSLPRGVGGKIDRKCLGERITHFDAPPIPESTPASQTETALLKLWTELLGRAPRDMHESFFAAGGHSLLANRLVSMVRRDLGVDLPVRSIFDDPTISGLASRIDATGSVRAGEQVIRASRAGPAFPLSRQQLRAWNQHVNGAPPDFVNRSRAWSLYGALDLEVFRSSLASVLSNTEIFRGSFSDSAAGPEVRLAAQCSLPLIVEDMRELAGEQRDLAIGSRISEDARHVFDLATPPLLLLRLIIVSDDESMLIVSFHSIVMDGWSVNELVRLLVEGASGKAQRVPDEFQYLDYAAWQPAWLASEVGRQKLRRHCDSLTGLPGPPTILADFAAPAVRRFSGDSLRASLSSPLAEQVHQLARTAGATPFMVMVAALGISLSRAGNSREVVVGTWAANRRSQHFNAVIGCMANPIVIRLPPIGRSSAGEYLRTVREVTVAAYEIEDAAYEDSPPTEVAKDAAHDARCLTYLILHDHRHGAVSTGKIKVVPFDFPVSTSRYDLCFVATLMPDGMKCTLEYSTELYEPTTAERVLADWIDALTLVAGNGESRTVEPTERDAPATHGARSFAMDTSAWSDESSGR